MIGIEKKAWIKLCPCIKITVKIWLLPFQSSKEERLGGGREQKDLWVNMQVIRVKPIPFHKIKLRAQTRQSARIQAKIRVFLAATITV